MTTPAKIAVVYDRGAVAAGEIAAGLTGLGTPVFLTPDSPHTRRMLHVLEGLGTVLPLTGDLAADTEAVRDLAPAAVLTFSESMLRTTAALTGALGLPGHDPDTAQLLTDKTRQRARLREAGVDDVRSHPLHTAEDGPRAFAVTGLPAIIKPVRGEGSRATYVVHTEEEAARVVAEAFAAVPAAGPGPVFVAEEFLQGRRDLPFGDYVAVESLCSPHGVTHLAVSGKYALVPPFREAGVYWPSALGADEESAVEDLAGRALAALGVTSGLAHTEIKLTPDGPRIIEVNGRIGGHVNHLAQFACGVDLVRMAALLALGRRVRPPRLRPEQVHFLRYGLAPVEPATLTAVHGDHEVRELPGIAGYRTYRRIGDRLDGGVMTQPMDLLWGVAPDHAAMGALVDKALSVLGYEFEFAEGTRRLAARDLLC
ncbi:ATP-grasp domain-containing protein [Streptomyces sp. BBFR2]|uniref:ATP-grasp domain-containing protein n=1 Tax=Streptomyces sp. BBFR2 TaxID=3372854 RepID=UPI0037D9AB7B